MENGKKFREMLVAICDRYDKKPSQLLSEMIWEALQPYSDSDCIAAFNHVFRHGRFFKDIVPDLLDFIGTLSPAFSVEDKAIVEADKILSHLKRYGGSKLPEIDDPVTKHLMTERWPYKNWAKHVKESENAWWKKEFIESYKSYAKVENLQIKAPEKVLKLVEGIGS